tara:strand:- start:6845 stop:7333 length:489 start_codon:yes stop_codon:yes gene_type:complete
LQKINSLVFGVVGLDEVVISVSYHQRNRINNHQKIVKMESISPNIFVKNMDETIKFYEQLEFKLTMRVPNEGDLVWAMMTNGNVVFMFQTLESLGDDLPEISRQEGGSLLLYIQLKEIRQYHDRIENKVRILKGLEKTFYGATEFSIRDINGYILTFAENEG